MVAPMISEGLYCSEWVLGLEVAVNGLLAMYEGRMTVGWNLSPK